MAALPSLDFRINCVTACLPPASKEWRLQGTQQASSKALNEEPTLFSKNSHFELKKGREGI